MTKATPESLDSLVFECDFEEPPEKVWRALTEPRLLDKWLTADELSEYEVVTAEPHRLLRFRWRDWDNGARDTGNTKRDSGDRKHDSTDREYDSGDREVHSLVTVELAPSPDGGTHLRLTHGGFTIVSTAPSMTAARVRPITSARRARARRTVMVSLAAQYSWRRAA